MTNTKSKPRFSIIFLSPKKSFQWCIALNGEVIHQIDDFIHFFKAIGHPNLDQKIIDNKVNIKNNVELTKNNDHDLDNCLQHKIAVYLFSNCGKFKKEYGMYYASVIEECKSLSMKANSKCSDCYIPKKNQWEALEFPIPNKS
jgi:hypothetical protein